MGFSQNWGFFAKKRPLQDDFWVLGGVFGVGIGVWGWKTQKMGLQVVFGVWKFGKFFAIKGW
jgi:hypothetical protein